MKCSFPGPRQIRVAVLEYCQQLLAYFSANKTMMLLIMLMIMII